MGPSRRVIDDRKRTVEVPGPLTRVVSLVPSDTLNVAALGCAAALVGRTDYCELPEDVVARVPSVGGTKNPRIDDIVRLEPELVLGNQEENTRSDLEALAQRGVKVYVAFPRRVIDGLAHLARLARLFGVARRSAGPRAPQAGIRRPPRGRAGPGRPRHPDLLPDLDGPAHDHPRRHVHQRHARPLRRAERLRRSAPALPARRGPRAARRPSRPRRSPGATCATRGSPSTRSSPGPRSSCCSPTNRIPSRRPTPTSSGRWPSRPRRAGPSSR